MEFLIQLEVQPKSKEITLLLWDRGLPSIAEVAYKGMVMQFNSASYLTSWGIQSLYRLCPLRRDERKHRSNLQPNPSYVLWMFESSWAPNQIRSVVIAGIHVYPDSSTTLVVKPPTTSNAIYRLLGFEGETKNPPQKYVSLWVQLNFTDKSPSPWYLQPS